MSVSTIVPVISYTANGDAGVVYPIPFDIIDATHLSMYIDGVLTAGGRTVIGIGTGTVTVTTDINYDDGVIVLFERNTTLGQVSVFVEGESLPAKKLTVSLDLLAMQTQEVSEDVGRSVKSPIGSIFRASRTIGIDSAGVAYDRTDQEEVAFLGFQNVLSRIASLEVAVESLGGDVTPPTIPANAILDFLGQTILDSDNLPLLAN